MKKVVIASVLTLLASVLPSAAHALNCSEAAGRAAAQQSRSAWASWCTGCGGTVMPGPYCKPGPNRGGGASSSGGLSSGAEIGAAIGSLIVDAVKQSSAEDARRKEEAEARAAEERRIREEEEFKRQEEIKNRLQGGLMGLGESTQLGLMGVETGSGLGLMTDNASATPPPKGSPPADRNVEEAKSEAYSKGFEHASQCISQNSAAACVAGQPRTCEADYRAGYDLGGKQRELVLQEAYQAGHNAGARGELSNGGSDPRAKGPCRLDWIQSYNRGHWRGKNAK